MKGKRVLIAEEESGVARLLEVLMQRRGATTAVVGNGLHAMQAVQEETPDLIVMDLVMPIKSGAQVLDELREDPKTARIPVVVLTTDENYHLLPDPGIAHVKKPFDLSLLEAAVEQAMMPSVQAAG